MSVCEELFVGLELRLSKCSWLQVWRNPDIDRAEQDTRSQKFVPGSCLSEPNLVIQIRKMRYRFVIRTSFCIVMDTRSRFE